MVHFSNGGRVGGGGLGMDNLLVAVWWFGCGGRGDSGRMVVEMAGPAQPLGRLGNGLRPHIFG